MWKTFAGGRPPSLCVESKVCRLDVVASITKFENFWSLCAVLAQISVETEYESGRFGDFCAVLSQKLTRKSSSEALQSPSVNKRSQNLVGKPWQN
ncbi:hypothetical protein QE152_g28333 [Popillia japonica]|uniref:Uncharacterized protein n=1 Tax=Popillia japonica TaxID=7064 RepID=A0AAW1JMT5_POPJA